jgi:SAM-dependent methyltransferase
MPIGRSISFHLVVADSRGAAALNLLSQERREYLQQKHALHVYHFDAIDALLDETDLSGKRVLEIGGSNMPRELLAEDFRVDNWVSVDMVDMTHYARAEQIEHYRREPIYPLAEAERRLFSDTYTIFNGAAEHIGPEFFGRFDIVVSIAAFEHIGRLATVLRKCYKALRPGGILFSYFAPVYSCRAGHHCWVTEDLNFNNPGKLPDFCHLLWKPAELLKHLVQHYPVETAEEAVYQIYYSDRINRNSYEDYQQYLGLSPFEQYECRPYGAEAVDADLQRRLEVARPGCNQFGAYGMQVIARKLANTASFDT